MSGPSSGSAAARGWPRIAVVALIGSILAVIPAGQASASPGDLDRSFGSGGIVTTDMSGFDVVNGVALQADGEIVVAGYALRRGSYDFAVARYTASGALDAAFGSGGTVTTSFGSSDDVASGLAIQADGKIVVVGSTLTGDWDLALARYTTSGALDPTFGTGGTVTTSIGSGNDVANGVAIQADGRILVAGYSNESYNDADFALARYTTSGALDQTFGSGGTVTTSFGPNGDVAHGLAIQANGKIVLAGETWNGSDWDFALARYKASGAIDPRFGSLGRVTTSLGPGADDVRGVAIQANGRIVAAGTSWGERGYQFALARYGASGAMDTTFGPGGVVTTSFGPGDDVAYGLAIQSDGRIVAAGMAGEGGIVRHFGLARYTSSGAPDPTFGDGGTVVTPIGSSSSVYGVAIQADGKIVAAGFVRNTNNDFALARYEAT